jgi:uncharacterized protein GlcG (DUF336 family)
MGVATTTPGASFDSPQPVVRPLLAAFRSLSWKLALAFTAFLLISSATARSQGPWFVSQKALTLDGAQAIAKTALGQCRSQGYHVSVSVIDAGGLPKVYLRDDGSALQTIDVSRRKAYTALIYQKPSSATVQAWQGDPHRDLVLIEGTVALGGGVPIKAGGEVIGGLGVSGAPGEDKDEACAMAGLKVADTLK